MSLHQTRQRLARPRAHLWSIPRCWGPSAPWAGLTPCLLILQGCDLELLQTQPWVWPSALWLQSVG